MEKLFGIAFGIFFFCLGLWLSYKLKKGFVYRIQGKKDKKTSLGFFAARRRAFFVSVKESDPMEVLFEILFIGFCLIFGLFTFLIYLNT